MCCEAKVADCNMLNDVNGDALYSFPYIYTQVESKMSYRKIVYQEINIYSEIPTIIKHIFGHWPLIPSLFFKYFYPIQFNDFNINSI